MKLLQKVWNHPLFPPLLIYTLSAFSLWFVRSGLTSNQILQILGLFIVGFLILQRFALMRILQVSRPAFKLIILIIGTAFVYLLVLSTGGFASSFLILIHLSAIALAFFFRPQLSLHFLLASLGLLGADLLLTTNVQQFLTQNPFLMGFYILTFLAVVPLSYTFAYHSKFQAEWIEALRNQLALTKREQATLLANIKDGVCLLDREFRIVLLNEIGQKLSGYSEDEVKNQPFTQIFKLRSWEGNSIPIELTLTLVLKEKQSFAYRFLSLEGKAAKEVKYANASLHPIISGDGVVSGVIFTFHPISIEMSHLLEHKDTFEVAGIAFEKETFLLGELLRKIASLKPRLRDDLSKAYELTTKIKRLSEELVLTLRLDYELSEGIITPVDLTYTLEKARADAQEFLTESKAQITIKTAVKRPLHVLAERRWLKTAFEKIFILISYLAPESTTDLSLEENRGKVLVRAFLPKQIDTQNLPYLTKEFFGGKGFSPLSNATRLEGYLAQTLLRKMGGDLKIESSGDKILILAKLNSSPKS